MTLSRRLDPPATFTTAAWMGLLLALGLAHPARTADWVWVEGEQPVEATVTRHPGWYDQVPRAAFSGSDFLSHFHDTQPGEAEYRFAAPAAGDYDFWVRANPHETQLDFRLNGGAWRALATTNAVQQFTLTGWDMRFLGWVRGGRVPLMAGQNRIRFRFTGLPKPHGMLDCFVLSREPFEPFGILKPDQVPAARAARATEETNWFDFAPAPGAAPASSAIDLRFLNEKVAGEHGRIEARDGQFVHQQTGQPVRFWAVNGPPHELTGDALKACARRLAQYGVNLVRVHGAVFDEKTGELRPERAQHLAEIVAAMKVEGIYTHLSIYFPLWFKPQPGLSWLEGYDGNKHPFAALMFNEGFQQHWAAWWRAVLTARTSAGTPLLDEPALLGVEIQNEDSFFFWTFSEANLPKPQMDLLKRQFAAWLTRKYGTLEKALAAWSQDGKPASAPDGLPGFPPLWQMGSRKNAQDRDAASFLLETQRRFYSRAVEVLRAFGFRGLVTPSNWTTANQEVLGPLEKYSYTVGDFIDRHGYLGCRNSGLFSEWSIRDGHTYADRSALRFEAEEPGGRPQFNHPIIDIEYDGKPSMISETTWNRPNRFRSEAPLFLAAYGALQDTDAIVHFAFDGAEWSVKPNFFMQPWTLMAPSQMGQFPAAALIYRKGLVRAGEVLADLQLGIDDLKNLRGTPLPQDAAFDELRLKDVPAGTEVKAGNRIDPLIHFAGRTRVTFAEHAGPPKLAALARYVDRERRTVTSSTGELKLDYGRGRLTINAPGAQGASGNLRDAGEVRLRDVSLESSLDNLHLVIVALDDQPLAASRKMLLQVMSEERTTGWRSVPQGGLQLIESIGKDPWRVRKLVGTVTFLRPDAAQLKTSCLDWSGRPLRELAPAATIRLEPDVVYYMITR